MSTLEKAPTGRRPAATVTDVELVIGGMTCASCARRVERKLGRIAGVTATVNYATERAHVTAPFEISPETLVAEIEAAGYTAGPVGSARGEMPAVDPDRAGRDRLLTSVALTVPVVVLAMVPAWQFTYWQWISLALAAPVATWAAWPFHRAAVRNLRHGATTMDTLVSIGVTASFGWSLWSLLFGVAGLPGLTHGFELTLGRSEGDHSIYLEVAAGVTSFLLAGRYLEARAKRYSRQALRALLDLRVELVSVRRPGGEERIPLDRLAIGDEFVVRPGERIATDGTVLSGRSAVDLSLLTGESVPVGVGPGDEVTGSTVNTGGRLVVRATRLGADTCLGRMTALLEEAQTGTARVQRLADRVSRVFVPVVICLAAATAGFWLGHGSGAGTALSAGVAVLVIACPCALGLATPTALLAGTGRGARMGILIKGPEVLEAAGRVDVVVLDKTGTLTTGRMGLVGLHPAHGVDGSEALRMAGAVEAASQHPIGAAIACAARERCGDLPEAGDFTAASPGVVSGVVRGETVQVGRLDALQPPPEVPAELAEVPCQVHDRGGTAVVVAWGGRVRAVLAVADTLRPTSAGAVRELRARGLRPILLTGDDETVARAVAAAAGIDEVVAGCTPAGKLDAVEALQRGGHTVAMVGDGVNDAAALARADLGLAMGTGTDVAIEAGDITLVRGDLTAAVDAVALARRTLGTIKSNLFWAFAYNLAALPLAAAGLLNPMIAGAAMAASSVFVVTNSLRLRRFRSIRDRV